MEDLTFVNTSYDTRNGFGHKSELYHLGRFLCESRATYLNRTWESYRFQTVMKDVVHKAIDNEVLAQKKIKQINRLTQQARQQIESENSFILLLKEKLKTL